MSASSAGRSKGGAASQRSTAGVWRAAAFVEHDVDVEFGPDLVVVLDQEVLELDRAVPSVQRPDGPARSDVRRAAAAGVVGPLVVVGRADGVPASCGRLLR